MLQHCHQPIELTENAVRTNKCQKRNQLCEGNQRKKSSLFQKNKRHRSAL